MIALLNFEGSCSEIHNSASNYDRDIVLEFSKNSNNYQRDKSYSNAESHDMSQSSINREKSHGRSNIEETRTISGYIVIKSNANAR